MSPFPTRRVAVPCSSGAVKCMEENNRGDTWETVLQQDGQQ